MQVQTDGEMLRLLILALYLYATASLPTHTPFVPRERLRSRQQAEHASQGKRLREAIPAFEVEGHLLNFFHNHRLRRLGAAVFRVHVFQRPLAVSEQPQHRRPERLQGAQEDLVPRKLHLPASRRPRCTSPIQARGRAAAEREQVSRRALQAVNPRRVAARAAGREAGVERSRATWNAAAATSEAASCADCSHLRERHAPLRLVTNLHVCRQRVQQGIDGDL